MSKYALKKKEPVISHENALAQMMLFLERYEIDIESFDDEEQKQLERNTDQVVKYIMQGRIEIEEIEGEVKVTLNIQNRSKGSTIEKLVFGEVQGKHKAQMKKDANEHSRMNQLMGAVCQTAGGHSAVEQLRTGDRKALEAIAVYFL